MFINLNDLYCSLNSNNTFSLSGVTVSFHVFFFRRIYIGILFSTHSKQFPRQVLTFRMMHHLSDAARF